MNQNRIIFHVVGQPIPKARARVTRYGTYTPETTGNWEKLVGDEAALVMRGHEIFTGPLRVVLHFRRKSLVHCDLDNLQKSVLDALKGIVWVDDCQIVELHSTMVWGVTDPGVRIVIEELPPAGKTGV